MKRKTRVAFLAAMVLSGGLAFAAAKANFNGTWVMDKTRSEGLPPGVEQLMTITQTGDKLALENKIVTPAGEITISDTFNLNGKEEEVTEKRNDEELKGKRTSKWLADGSGFESSDELTTVGGDGLPISQQINRKWIMSADGKTFTVDLSGTTPRGEMHSKRVFVRK